MSKLLCKLLGHKYDIFEHDGIVYRNCRRCSGCHEVIGETRERLTLTREMRNRCDQMRTEREKGSE
jgi:hypothetical protein